MIIGIVPAKGSSERVKCKNKQKLGDYALFVHAIRKLQVIPYIDKVVIDSDDNEILKIGKRHGAIPLKRPKHLADNKTDGNQLMHWEAKNFKDSDIIVQLLPTSPFINPTTFLQGIIACKSYRANSALTVRVEPLYIIKKHRYYGKVIDNSNKMKPTIYETTGLYISKTKFILKNKLRTDFNNCAYLPVSKIEAVDINTEEDLQFARLVYEGLQC